MDKQRTVSGHDGWVNSSGHRLHMLGACDFLGVGAAYTDQDLYHWYMTQDFFSE